MKYTMLGNVHQINLQKTNIIDIGDLKNYIVNIDKKYLIENLKITYIHIGLLASAPQKIKQVLQYAQAALWCLQPNHCHL